MVIVSDIRLYGNIPQKLPDNVIETHLAGGIVEAKHNIADFDVIESGSGIKHDDLQELIKCYTLISLLPVANTFFVEGMPALSEEGVSSRFFSPSEIGSLIDRYSKRAKVLKNRINELKKNVFSFKIIGN